MCLTPPLTPLLNGNKYMYVYKRNENKLDLLQSKSRIPAREIPQQFMPADQINTEIIYTYMHLLIYVCMYIDIIR